MKTLYFALALLPGLLASAPALAEREVTAYRKLSRVDYRVLRIAAVAYAEAEAHQGLSFHGLGDDEGPFEIHCKGAVVMAVENGPARLALRMPSDALKRAPDVRRLVESFKQWGVEAARHARLPHVVEDVPHRERCLPWGQPADGAQSSKLDATAEVPVRRG